MLLSTRRSLEAYLVDSGCARCNVLDRLDFCGRSRTELDDERALACRFPTGIPYVRVALFLFGWRWSHNFVNRGCGERRAALPKTRARSHECLDCSRQTSFTAGTIMHRSKLPLTAWFRAAHLVTTKRTLNRNLYRTGDRMSPGSIVPAAVKAVAVPKKIGGNTFSASRLSATFQASGFSPSEFRFPSRFPLAP